MQTGPLSFKVELTDGRVTWHGHQDHLRKRYALPTERLEEQSFIPPTTMPSEPIPQGNSDVLAEPQESTAQPNEMQPDDELPVSEKPAVTSTVTPTFTENTPRNPQRIRKLPDRYSSD